MSSVSLDQLSQSLGNLTSDDSESEEIEELILKHQGCRSRCVLWSYIILGSIDGLWRKFWSTEKMD